MTRLTTLLGISCLVAGSADNPEEDFLIRPDGEMLLVTLDEDALADDEFVVAASAPVRFPSARYAG